MAYQRNGRASSSAMGLARGLGWFSVGLGLVEMLAPNMLARQMGMEGKEPLLRFYGAREMAAGVGILLSDNPGPWMWGRVAGDALDLATLATGLNDDNPQKGTVAVALAAVAGITALDCIGANALTGSNQEIYDYSDRRGLPRPPEEMRGAARKDFTAPRDMRTPELLRPFTSQSAAERTVAEHSRA
jgi:hypothetical protein